MSKDYTSKPKHIRIVHQPVHSNTNLVPDPPLHNTSVYQSPKHSTWKPVNTNYWVDDSDDKDTDKEDITPNQNVNIVAVDELLTDDVDNADDILIE